MINLMSKSKMTTIKKKLYKKAMKLSNKMKKIIMMKSNRILNKYQNLKALVAKRHMIARLIRRSQKN